MASNFLRKCKDVLDRTDFNAYRANDISNDMSPCYTLLLLNQQVNHNCSKQNDRIKIETIDALHDPLVLHWVTLKLHKKLKLGSNASWLKWWKQM